MFYDILQIMMELSLKVIMVIKILKKIINKTIHF